MISPELHCWSQVLGMPSIISVLMSKPRDVNWARCVSYLCTEMPVTLFSTSVMLERP